MKRADLALHFFSFCSGQKYSFRYIFPKFNNSGSKTKLTVIDECLESRKLVTDHFHMKDKYNKHHSVKYITLLLR